MDTCLALLGRAELQAFGREGCLYSGFGIVSAHLLGRFGRRRGNLGRLRISMDALDVIHDAFKVGHAAHQRRLGHGAQDVVEIRLIPVLRYSPRGVLLAVRAGLATPRIPFQIFKY